MMWRFVQAFGASPGVSVGGGVISDIYKLEERGTVMGTYFAVSGCWIWAHIGHLLLPYRHVCLDQRLLRQSEVR
jgi:MFS family permease